MELKAVIFDLDGVLIESEIYWRLAEFRVLTDLNIPLNFDNYKKTIGRRVDETVSYWYQKNPWKNKSLMEVQKEIINEATCLIVKKAPLKEGALQTITYFYNKNIPLFIASTAPRSLITKIVDRFQLKQYFTYLYSGFHLKETKPSPKIYQNLLRKFSIQAKDCLAIEDSPSGILSAKSAGLYCVAIPPSGFGKDPIYKSADLVVSSHESFRSIWRKKVWTYKKLSYPKPYSRKPVRKSDPW